MNLKLYSNVSKNFIRDIDDFWNDCILPREESKEKIIHSDDSEFATCNNTFDYLVSGKKEKQDSNRDIQKLSTEIKGSINAFAVSPERRAKKLIQKYNLNNSSSYEENMTKQKEEQKKKRSIERTNDLYRKAEIKTEKLKKIKAHNEEIKIQNEMKECTWRPITNTYNLSNKESIISKSMKKPKISRNLNMSQDMLQYSFNPVLNSGQNLDEMFRGKDIKYKDMQTHKFINRLNRAREDEIEKQRKLLPEYSK
jgi:hypothetical protein